MGVIIDTLKDAVSVIQDEDRRRKATERLERELRSSTTTGG
ncbi:MAG: hypothetical protein RXP86_09720 [Acidilobus sp.]